MATYVLVYKGGDMPESDVERNKIMAAWGTWFADLGDSLVDGGNPFGPARTIGNDGSVTEGGASDLSGYTILKAENIAAAVAAAKGCPVLLSGASVEVYEVFDVMAPTVTG